MRIFLRNRLIKYWKRHPDAEQQLKAWFWEVQQLQWKTQSALKEDYENALIIDKKRIVFNIKGNDYKLIVDGEYRMGILFIVWIGTQKEYDKINVNEVPVGKINISHEDYLYTMHHIFEFMEKDLADDPILEMLVDIADDYEDIEFPIDLPDPVESIKFRLEQMNLTESDLGELAGAKKRISEIMNRKRELDIAMIKKLEKVLKFPVASLIHEQFILSFPPSWQDGIRATRKKRN